MTKLSTPKLIKITLTSFLICFFLLIILDSSYEPTSQPINTISLSNMNQYVKITAKIKKQSLGNNIIFFDFYDNTSQIPAIIFDYNKTLDKKKKYEIIGKITVYKNKPEIIIYEIKG